MATFTKTAMLLALALTAGSVFAAAKPTTQTIATLGGKFTFKLPKAYSADTLPSGTAQDGTADTQGTLYANSTTKSVVIVAETVRNDGATIQDNDPQFLDDAVADFVKDQSAALPDFKKLGEKKLTDFKFEKKLKGFAIKEPVFSFNKFPGVNKELGPEMKSTGEAIRFVKDLRDPYFRQLYKDRSMYLSK